MPDQAQLDLICIPINRFTSEMGRKCSYTSKLFYVFEQFNMRQYLTPSILLQHNLPNLTLSYLHQLYNSSYITVAKLVKLDHNNQDFMLGYPSIRVKFL